MGKPLVQFVTKEGGCSLCDDLFIELESAADYVDFYLEILKIEQDKNLYEKYWDKIPVVLVDGKMAVKYRATRDELIRKIGALCSGRELDEWWEREIGWSQDRELALHKAQARLDELSKRAKQTCWEPTP